MQRLGRESSAYGALITRLNGRFQGHGGDGTPPCPSAAPWGRRAAQIGVTLTIGLILAAAWIQRHDVEQIVGRWRYSPWGWIYLGVGKWLLLLNLALFLWYIGLVRRYRPVQGRRDPDLPPCTVIVPAYNEGKHVLRTLRSVVRSEYPPDKLQIIAVDDGSADDTWRWIVKAAAEYPGRIETIRMPHNAGKRRALYEGFIRSRGEILVTLDSDSLIEPKTLRHLVSPFVVDPKVGAVAGNVCVLNHHEGPIPRMLDVTFAYSFEFVRAAQSRVNGVFCTPGALAAYRRGPVMKHLHAWLNQTFLGRPAKIGEDRAITNLVLEEGYHVTFQSSAVVYTNVPVQYDKLCKMYLRWARSDLRELVVMGAFVFKDFRPTSATGIRINFLSSCINWIVGRFLQMGCIACLLLWPGLFLVQAAASAVVMACAPAGFHALRRTRGEALWAFVYGLFWLVGLWWISSYALMTVRNDKWLTRDIAPGRRFPIPVGPRPTPLTNRPAA